MKLRMYLAIPALLAISTILGFIFLGIAYLATLGPLGVSAGYPLTYSYLNVPCANPFLGCGYSYNLIFVSLDYLFWFAVAFVTVFAVSVAWTLRRSI